MGLWPHSRRAREVHGGGDGRGGLYRLLLERSPQERVHGGSRAGSRPKSIPGGRPRSKPGNRERWRGTSRRKRLLGKIPHGLWPDHEVVGEGSPTSEIGTSSGVGVGVGTPLLLERHSHGR
jgi:hypothetical protein